MAGSLTLDSWPQPTGFDTASYYNRFLEQMQFGLPGAPGILPSSSDDILGSYTSEFLVIADSTGMQVKVAQGRMTAKGIFAKVQDSAVTGGVYALTVTNAHATLQRVDRVIVRFNLATGAVTLMMLDGTAAATGAAVPAALTQTAVTWEECLALVMVDPTVTTIAPVDVIDTRRFSSTDRQMARALNELNPIINGGMQVWNDGTSFAAIADATYGPEMFRYGKVGAVVHTVTQDTDVPAVSADVSKELYSTKLDVTTADSSIAAGDYCIYEQRVEGQRAKRLLQRGFTLPFWVKQPSIGVYYAAFVNSGGDRSCVVPYFIEAADTWELHWAHVPASPTAGTWDYTTGIGVRVIWTLSCGSTFQQGSTVQPGTWQTGLFYGQARQFNATGSTAYNTFLAMVGRMSLGGVVMPFSPHDDEEALTKRYYEIFGSGISTEAFGNGSYLTTTAFYVALRYLQKRTTPAMTVSGNADFTANPGGTTSGFSGAQAGLAAGFGVFTTPAVGAADKAGILYAQNSNARIKINARM